MAPLSPHPVPSTIRPAERTRMRGTNWREEEWGTAALKKRPPSTTKEFLEEASTWAQPSSKHTRSSCNRSMNTTEVLMSQRTIRTSRAQWTIDRLETEENLTTYRRPVNSTRRILHNSNSHTLRHTVTSHIPRITPILETTSNHSNSSSNPRSSSRTMAATLKLARQIPSACW